jgi:AcrR family transcriptional regulator
MLDHPQPDTRTRVLDAAEHIVQARGVPALTLDAAAREAGVSKGGLLYHFASKEALLQGLMLRLSEYIRLQFDMVHAGIPEGPGRAARALLAWQFDSGCATDERTDRACAIFLAAHHHDTALLDPVRKVFADIRGHLLRDGLKPGRALAIMAACDGLFMAHLFRLYVLDEAELAALRAALETLLEAAP